MPVILNRAGIRPQANRGSSPGASPRGATRGSDKSFLAIPAFQGRNSDLQTAYNSPYLYDIFGVKNVWSAAAAERNERSDGYAHPSGRKAAAVRFAVTDAISISKFRSSHKHFMPRPLHISLFPCRRLSEHPLERKSVAKITAK